MRPVVSSLVLLSLASPTLCEPAATAPIADGATMDAVLKTDAEVRSDEKGKPDDQGFDAIVKDAEKHGGFFTLYKAKRDLYAEVRPDQLETLLRFRVSRGSGVGEREIYFAHPFNVWVVLLRRVDDQVQIVQPNLRFRPAGDSAMARSARRSYADSILAAFKIEATHPERKTLLIKLNSFFLTDVGGLLRALNAPGEPSSFSLDADKSHWGTIQVFPQNVEWDAVLVFGSPDRRSISTIPDTRGFEVTVHYSLAELPPSDYRPRLADPRVGIYVHRLRDETIQERAGPWKRFIDRWNLQKRDRGARLSPPRQPIVFYLENNVPPEYRPALREGILMWNRAFERIGIQNAIEVREQPDDAEWDVNDIRYNTLRWISSVDAGYAAAGPIVHPLTGEILQAQIVVHGNFVRSGGSRYEEEVDPQSQPVPPALDGGSFVPPCQINQAATTQAAFGLTALELGATPASEAEKKRYLQQLLRYMAAHEMGHCLALNHNWHGSTLLPLRDLHNTAVTRTRGLSGSVMEYCPPNIAPPGTSQGDYFPQALGPWDLWAIEYAYTPIEASTPEEELPALRRIAARSADPALAYAPERDTSAPGAVDPLLAPWDLSRDPLGWSEQRLRLCLDRLRRLEVREPALGKSYTEARRKFVRLLGAYLDLMLPISRHVGGIYTSRSFRGDPGAGPPQKPVPVAEQRRALRLLGTYLFDAGALHFSPALLNRLAREDDGFQDALVATPEIWQDDYPLREQILSRRKEVLARLTHPALLSRLLGGEMRVASPAETLTLPELFRWLTNAIWSEIEGPGPRKPISVLRRGLQREHLGVLLKLMLQPAPGTPEDACVLAWVELRALRRRLVAAQTAPEARDAYTNAHLAESAVRIARALDARMAAPGW